MTLNRREALKSFAALLAGISPLTRNVLPRESGLVGPKGDIGISGQPGFDSKGAWEPHGPFACPPDMRCTAKSIYEHIVRSTSLAKNPYRKHIRSTVDTALYSEKGSPVILFIPTSDSFQIILSKQFLIQSIGSVNAEGKAEVDTAVLAAGGVYASGMDFTAKGDLRQDSWSAYTQQSTSKTWKPKQAIAIEIHHPSKLRAEDGGATVHTFDNIGLTTLCWEDTILPIGGTDEVFGRTANFALTAKGSRVYSTKKAMEQLFNTYSTPEESVMYSSVLAYLTAINLYHRAVYELPVNHDFLSRNPFFDPTQFANFLGRHYIIDNEIVQPEDVRGFANSVAGPTILYTVPPSADETLERMINARLTASDWRFSNFKGTPKNFENNLEKLWEAAANVKGKPS